jgi:hypothetical protein
MRHRSVLIVRIAPSALPTFVVSVVAVFVMIASPLTAFVFMMPHGSLFALATFHRVVLVLSPLRHVALVPPLLNALLVVLFLLQFAYIATVIAIMVMILCSSTCC